MNGLEWFGVGLFVGFFVGAAAILKLALDSQINENSNEENK